VSLLRDYAAAVEAHYNGCWGATLDRWRPTEGPVDDLLGFEVLAIERRGIAAVATVGMSKPSDSAIEVHVLLRREELEAAFPAVAEVLAAASYYHRTAQPLGLGHTVNIGRPIVAGSSCDYGLLSLPYLDGPKLEWMEAPRTRCLWFIPITLSEREFKKSHGLEALEDLFEETGFNYLDLMRPSVVGHATGAKA